MTDELENNNGWWWRLVTKEVFICGSRVRILKLVRGESLKLLTWPIKSLQLRYSWGRYTLWLCDIMRDWLRPATQLRLLTSKTPRVTSMSNRNRYRATSHDRTADQPHEYLDCNGQPIFGQGGRVVGREYTTMWTMIAQRKTSQLSCVSESLKWPIGYGAGLRIKRSSVRIWPWPLRWILGQGSLLPLSQGEAFTLASISYLAILVKYILAEKKWSFQPVWLEVFPTYPKILQRPITDHVVPEERAYTRPLLADVLRHRRHMPCIQRLTALLGNGRLALATCTHVPNFVRADVYVAWVWVKGQYLKKSVKREHNISLR